jgi:hypothetical protein
MDPGPYSVTAIEPRWTTIKCSRCDGAGDVTTTRCPHCGLAIDKDSELGAWDSCQCSDLAASDVSDTVEELAWYATRHDLEGGYRREVASPREQVRTLEAIARELKLVNVPVALEVRAGILERVASLEATHMLGEVVA